MRPIKLYKRDRGAEGSRARWVCPYCLFKTDDYGDYQNHVNFSLRKFIKNGIEIIKTGSCKDGE